MKIKSNGYSIIEMLMVMGIFAMLLALITINLSTTQPRTSLNTQINTIIADIKQQQLKAMLGSSENNQPQQFGIYFELTRYTLFTGSSYSPASSSNFVINLDSNIEFSIINFPDSSIVFEKGSGEIASFLDGSALGVRNTANNDQKIITFNKLGNITSFD